MKSTLAYVWRKVPAGCRMESGSVVRIRLPNLILSVAASVQLASRCMGLKPLCPMRVVRRRQAGKSSDSIHSLRVVAATCHRPQITAMPIMKLGCAHLTMKLLFFTAFFTAVAAQSGGISGCSELPDGDLGPCWWKPGTDDIGNARRDVSNLPQSRAERKDAAGLPPPLPAKGEGLCRMKCMALGYCCWVWKGDTCTCTVHGKLGDFRCKVCGRVDKIEPTNTWA